MAKKPKPKAPAKPSLDQRIRTDAKLRARVLANPGLRAKLSVSSLQKYAPAQARARQTNIRLNAPITPGSSTTERDLAHEAQAATTVRYQPQESAIGQQLGVAQQVERDTGSFYDQYRQALQQHQANVQAFQAGAQQALQQTQAGITGLGQQQAAEMQAQANAGAAQQGVAQAGNLAPLADQALGVRQQLAGTFGAQQAMTGAAANTYADTLANVVAPGQKLAAQAQARGRTRDVRQKLTDLKTEEGAFNQQFRDTRRQDEFKNVLAMQTLGVNASAKAADAAAKTPEAQASVAGAKASATQAAKYGRTPHQWAMLGPTGRAKVIAASKKTKTNPGSDVITSGPLAGKTKRWVAAHPTEAGKLVSDYEANKGSGGKNANPKTVAAKDFRNKYGVDLQPTSQHNTARNDVENAQTAFGQVGKDVVGKDGVKRHVTTDLVVAALRNKGIPNVLIRAALDIQRYGHITPGTANRLHHSGYSVAQLGFQTGPPTRRGRSGSNIPPGKV